MTPPVPRLPSLARLNSLPFEAFSAALAPLFEAAAPLAEPLYAARPFASYDTLIERAEAVASGLSADQQIEVVNAHPRIGANARDVSALSYQEQGYAAEAGADLAQVYAELNRLNRDYERRFGFRFVVFVNKRSKQVILDVLRERITGRHEDELQTALKAIFLIARDRLASLQYDAGMPPQRDSSAHTAVLHELARAALETYGEERSGEATLKTALGIAATALWRVEQETLEPLGSEPLPTHG